MNIMNVCSFMTLVSACVCSQCDSMRIYIHESTRDLSSMFVRCVSKCVSSLYVHNHMSCVYVSWIIKNVCIRCNAHVDEYMYVTIIQLSKTREDIRQMSTTGAIIVPTSSPKARVCAFVSCRMVSHA